PCVVGGRVFGQGGVQVLLVRGEMRRGGALGAGPGDGQMPVPVQGGDVGEDGAGGDAQAAQVADELQAREVQVAPVDHVLGVADPGDAAVAYDAEAVAVEDDHARVVAGDGVAGLFVFQDDHRAGRFPPRAEVLDGGGEMPHAAGLGPQVRV